MLELRLTRDGLLKKVLESIRDLVTDANFNCAATGCSLQAMDSSRVAMLSLLLCPGGFEHYRCDRSISMGMNLANMARMLRCASDDDINLEIPEAGYEAIVKMPASVFARICKDLGTIGDTVMISVTKERIQFFTRDDIGTANIFCRKTTPVAKEEEAISIEMEKPVSLTLALRYLISFTKATPLAKQVTISMSYEQPIVVEYKMEIIGHIRFYLVPKVEEELTGPLENVAEADTKSKPDVKPEVEEKPKEVIEIEEGSELKAETKLNPEKNDIDDQSEPKLGTKPKEGRINETMLQVEDKTEVEVMDVE
ncbi:proliferating cell nuclear antigen-like [Gossypium australe]|uniref:DNA sliding clamp PCNA n=1 Tax=Gossypium australe TaxID=47621 RepID=A0A5B6V504_9ROSI|nr:proliferating cell nuclear antigen-like [Gossypium australe]